MRCILPAVLCAFGVCSSAAYGQHVHIQPVHVAAGTVLTFYSQTRLNPGAGNILDALPKGTILKVKLLESIDSSVNPDGFEFHGLLVTPLTVGNEVLVRSDAEIHGLLVLLRSRSHPEGFRFDLLITGITENGKSYELTASLNLSFFETASQQPSSANSGTLEHAKESPAGLTKLPDNKNPEAHISKSAPVNSSSSRDWRTFRYFRDRKNSTARGRDFTDQYFIGRAPGMVQPDPKFNIP